MNRHKIGSRRYLSHSWNGQSTTDAQRLRCQRWEQLGPPVLLLPCPPAHIDAASKAKGTSRGCSAKPAKTSPTPKSTSSSIALEIEVVVCPSRSTTLCTGHRPAPTFGHPPLGKRTLASGRLPSTSPALRTTHGVKLCTVRKRLRTGGNGESRVRDRQFAATFSVTLVVSCSKDFGCGHQPRGGLLGEKPDWPKMIVDFSRASRYIHIYTIACPGAFTA